MDVIGRFAPWSVSCASWCALSKAVSFSIGISRPCIIAHRFMSCERKLTFFWVCCHTEKHASTPPENVQIVLALFLSFVLILSGWMVMGW